jgi:hypothetical protein
MVDERDKIHDPYDPFSPWGCFIRAMLYSTHPENSFTKIKVTFVQHSVMCCHLCCITSWLKFPN